MIQVLNLFTVYLLLILLWNIRWVKFNTDYLSLSTTDYFKGWFAVAIVLIHLSSLLNTPWALFHPFERASSYFILAAFLFFSGFGSQKRHMSVPNYASNFLWRRLSKIFVPYLLVSICYFFIQMCYGEQLEFHLIFFPWLQGKTLVPPGWFLFYLAAFYVAFYGLMKCFKQNYKAIFIGTIVYCILWVIFCFMLGYGRRWFFNIAALPLGIFCAWKQDLVTRLLKKSYKWLFMATTVAICFIVWAFHWKYLLPYYVLYNASSVLFVIVLLLFSAKFQIGNRELSFLGNIYLEVYLVQAIFIYTVPMQRFRALLSDDFSWCLIVLIGTIIGGYALHIMCQKSYKYFHKQKITHAKSN